MFDDDLVTLSAVRKLIPQYVKILEKTQEALTPITKLLKSKFLGDTDKDLSEWLNGLEAMAKDLVLIERLTAEASDFAAAEVANRDKPDVDSYPRLEELAAAIERYNDRWNDLPFAGLSSVPGGLEDLGFLDSSVIDAIVDRWEKLSALDSLELSSDALMLPLDSAEYQDAILAELAE